MIRVLHDDPAENAAALADADLEMMIDACSDAFMSSEATEWKAWIYESYDNYALLLEFAKACCYEYTRRFTHADVLALVDAGEPLVGRVKYHTSQGFLKLAQRNAPPLPSRGLTYMPITMHERYWVIEDPVPVCDLIASHRKCYVDYLKTLARYVRCPSCSDVSWKQGCDTCGGEGQLMSLPIWTRRFKPDWADICNYGVVLE